MAIQRDNLRVRSCKVCLALLPMIQCVLEIFGDRDPSTDIGCTSTTDKKINRALVKRKGPDVCRGLSIFSC